MQNSEQRTRLLGVKLRTLVSDHVGGAVEVEPRALPSGAGLVHGDAAWVLVDGDARRALGPALAWSIRRGATTLDLVAEADTGLLARRAELVEFPVTVWFAQERSLLAAVAEPLGPPAPADPDHAALIPMIEAGGAEPLVTHGVVTGEVRGLEVCRVVAEPTTGRLTDADGVALAAIGPAAYGVPDGIQLEVGVGANDREAFHMVHGGVPTVEALAQVVESVREHRSAHAPQHPLNRMAPERFLLWQARQDPSAVGMAALDVVPPPVERPSMKSVAPAAAVGTDDAGRRHLIVFTSGVDLDVVPFALDAHLAASEIHDLDETVTIALRAKDLLPITTELAELAGRPVRFVTLD